MSSGTYNCLIISVKIYGTAGCGRLALAEPFEQNIPVLQLELYIKSGNQN